MSCVRIVLEQNRLIRGCIYVMFYSIFMSWYTHTISELLKMNVGALNLSSCSEKINFTVLFPFLFTVLVKGSGKCWRWRCVERLHQYKITTEWEIDALFHPIDCNGVLSEWLHVKLSLQAQLSQTKAFVQRRCHFFSQYNPLFKS